METQIDPQALVCYNSIKPEVFKYKLAREVVTNDTYRLNSLSGQKFDYILDIGANIGLFTLRARELWPEATICAIEPIRLTYQALVENVQGTECKHLQAALSDGTPLYTKPLYARWQQENPGGVNLLEKRHRQSVEVPIISFEELVNRFGCQLKTTLLKVDCEGGEKYLIKQENLDLLREIPYLAMELHRKLRTTEQWSSWLEEFEKTHECNLVRINSKQRSMFYATRK